MKKLLFTFGYILILLVCNAQNVGIGTTAPAYKLDVAGRMRLQHAGSNTAGMWLDGVTTTGRSFIGTINEDHVGLYGSGGAGWNFSMNVENGNTGIGVAAPTARLDVNGDIRIRGSFPKAGSVLTSADANGNARWMDPIAFRAVGGLDGLPNIISNNTWTKVFFNQTPNYNIGLNYQSLLSQFLVSENGIYHFDASVYWGELLWGARIRIMINRGGNVSVIAGNYQYFQDDDGLSVGSKISSAISIDASLAAGDLIWVEAYAFVDPFYGNSTTISADGRDTWFSGHLVARY